MEKVKSVFVCTMPECPATCRGRNEIFEIELALCDGRDGRDKCKPFRREGIVRIITEEKKA